ncbi:unnamed protein product [Rotaria sp. Silwood2]|nr:unnamed protein product [Rotaria sp. Silwood2]
MMKNTSKPLWDPRSLSPTNINNQQQQQEGNTMIRNISNHKRCHGNRKLRRLKNKCRQRGMNEEDIQRFIQERQQQDAEQRITKTNNIELPPPIKTTTTAITKQSMMKQKSEKRKRLTTSLSVPSIVSRTSKRKKTRRVKLKVLTEKFHGRLPTYLKKAPKILMQSVSLELQQKLKTVKQKRFLYYRLQLLDQHHRIDQYRSLWQSYLTIGSSCNLWPIFLHKKIKSKNSQSFKEYIQHHLNELQQQYDQCMNELNQHGELCPNVFQPLDILDRKLNDFVQLQRRRFIERLNTRLARYKTYIEENKFYQAMLYHIKTQEQKSMIDQLIYIREEQLKIFEHYLRLETRISFECLPNILHSIENMITSIRFQSRLDNFLTIQYQQQRYKLIQEAKRNCLNIFFQAYEIQYQHYEKQYQELFKQFESNNKTTSGSPLLECFLIYLNHRIHRLKQVIYYERIPLFRRKLRLRNQYWREKKKFCKQIQVSPRVILDVHRNPFTTTELKYLARGPTYIRPNQSTLRSMKQRHKQIQNEIKDILTKIKNGLANITRDGYPSIPMTASIYKLYEERLQTCFTFQYMKSLPFIEQLRARKELKWIKSIRRKLKRHKLILRQTDKSGVFHIGRLCDYERKAYNYRKTTGAYEVLSQNPLNDIFSSVVNLLNQLRSQKRILERQKQKLIPIQNKTELAYMYFLPKSHKKGTPLRPIINTIHAATTHISKYLDQSLRPLFDRYVRSTTLVDGVDLLNQLDQYIKKGHFKSSTLFITFDITNLYTMLPQEESLEILVEFLRQHHYHRIHGMSIETIIELARLVLQANAFVYGKKFYRQIIGGAMGSPFTLTLANIFMWNWERQTILPKLPSYELYGRYIDDVFFTSNENETTIKEWLDSINQFHPNIKLTYTISQCLPFLDVLLQNQNGTLHTSVYHKPAAEPTLLSYVSDHPRHIFRNVIQTALIRAIRYSSTLEAFNFERRTIRLTLLYNKYPSIYINEQFQQFFLKYLSTTSAILPLIDNEEQYVILRKNLLAQPSIKQILIDKSAATVENIIQDQNIQGYEGTTNEKYNKFRNKLFIHCLHEGRFRDIQRQIHEIHDSFFKNTFYQDIRLIVGHRNNPNIEFELTRKRPSSWLLKNEPQQKKTKI